MANASLAAALRQVCGWAARYADHNLPDRQLLERFLAQRDEAAFAALVRRHGGLVLGVARRILRDVHAAEDVFQNTFLTLARRAGSIRKRESLASWLYGVAARLASQARMQDVRRSAREREAMPPAAAEDIAEAVAWRELGAVLDEELQRLPERYRIPLVHIYFAGQTQEEAAQELDWSKGTLRRRLERGKRLLYDRLSRRGVLLSVGLLAAGVSQSGVEAALPPLLVRQTITEAVRIASAQAALCTVGVGSLSHAKIALVLGLLIVGGAGLAVFRMGGSEPPKAKQEESAKPLAYEAKRPRVDRFGDPLPPGAIARMGTMRLRHANGTTVAFAPDGKSLLTCGTDRTIRTWDATSGWLLREQQLPPDLLRNPVIAVFSPDSRLLVFEELFPTLVLWDVERNKIRHKFPINIPWPRLVFSPDGKMLAAAETDGTLRVWDTTTGKGRLLGRHDKRIDSLSFTADGTLMSLGNYKTIRFWDLTGGRERSRLTLSEPVPSAAVSPDGRTVAVASSVSVRFWDASTGEDVKGWLAPKVEEVRTVQSVTPLTDAQREAYWTDLAGDDAGLAFTAIVRLADEPKQTVPLLRARLHAAKAPSAEELCRLLADLDHAQFERREKATKRLAELGGLAQTALHEALQRKRSLEMRRRIENLLATSRLVHTPEERRHLRAVRILESISTPEARQVLKALSEGAPDARLTKAAKGALRRLARSSRPASD